MNELGYRLLVDKVIIRRVKILSTLIENNLKVSLRQIEIETKTSRRTILQDISHFNIEEHNNMHIYRTDDNFLILQCDNTLVVSEYISQLSKDSPLFRVIELCYFGKNVSLGKLSDILFVSESSLKKYLSKLKIILSEFSLSLQTSPLDIIGNENNIRFFYFQYFRYAHDNYNIYIREELTFLLCKTIYNIKDKNNFVLNLDYQRLSLWMSIFEQRIKLKRFTHIPDKIIKKHIYSSSYSRFKKFFLLNFQTSEYLNNIPESEIVYAFITRLDAIIYEKGNAFFMDDFLVEHLKYEDCISNFFKEKQLHLGMHIDLKLTLTAFLSNVMLLSDLTTYFQRTNEELLKYVHQHFQLMQNHWLTLFKNYSLDFHHPNEVAAKLTLLTAAYLKLNEGKKLLFSLTGDPSALMYYKSLATKVIPQGMDATFVFNEPLNNTLIKKLAIDICIHNFVPQEKLVVATSIKLSTVPQENEWESLLTKLVKISLNCM